MPRPSWRALAAVLLGAAAVTVAMMCTAGEAQAKPVSVPGIGEFEVPNEIAEVAANFGFRPVTIPGVADADAAQMTAVPENETIAPAPAAVAAVEPIPAPAVPEFRNVMVAGFGNVAIPNSLPLLTGIPGVTDVPVTTFHAAPATMPKSKGERAVEAARSRIGSNYRAGGNGPDSFDCSGLVQWSYAQAGVDLPRTSYSQLNSGTPVALDDLQPGDLVSFYGGGHSALYAGDGQVIHASTYGSGVTVSPMDNMPVTGARRF
ncbi:C40 family peptidase [Nocardia yamanashiensis]|uniref:C40 family peptidase n=1 Tax=Nocardia yamanashiensis TaxID=209247 RepID=UPI001E45D094|nr:C40 family peptidase [Nocardia yamanashiensis]UGT38988.1 C40 family peptidase [Nocardia yamanashiensis]